MMFLGGGGEGGGIIITRWGIKIIISLLKSPRRGQMCLTACD